MLLLPVYRPRCRAPLQDLKSAAPFEANLIYSAHSDCVDSVICNGKFVMKNRVVEGEKDVLSKARKYLNKIV